MQQGKDEASLALRIGFDDFAVPDAGDDVVDGNAVFEGFGKRMIDDEEITCVNFGANRQNIH